MVSSQIKTGFFVFWILIKVSMFVNTCRELEARPNPKEWPIWVWAWILLLIYVMFMSYSFEYAYFFVFGEYKKAVFLLFFGNAVIAAMKHVALTHTL